MTATPATSGQAPSRQLDLSPSRTAPVRLFFCKFSNMADFIKEGDTLHVHCRQKGSRLDIGIALDSSVDEKKIRFLADMSYELTKK